MVNFLHFLTALVAIACVHAISLDVVEEGTCAGTGFQAQEFINETWIGTVPAFYLVGGSSYHIFRTVLHAYENDHDRLQYLSEYQVSNDACFDVGFNAAGVKIKAFNTGLIEYQSKRISKGVSEFSSDKYDNTCRATVTLTDNRTFVVFATCWKEQDQKGWAVITTTKTISPEVRERVIDHSISLGFTRKKFFFLGGAHCPRNVTNTITYYAKTSPGIRSFGYGK